MPKRPGLSKEKLVDGAIEIINQEGLSSLSIASLAAKFKVKPPSLYNHIDGFEALQQAIALKGIKSMTLIAQKAAMGRAGFDALRATAIAYRDFAKNQPGLYDITLRSNQGQNSELAAAEKEGIDVFTGILRGYNLEAEQALHAVRAIRSSLHGFVALEIKGGFGLPLSIEESFDYYVRLLDRGLSTLQKSDSVGPQHA